MEETPGINEQRLTGNTVRLAECHHLIGDVILVHRPLQQRARLGLLTGRRGNIRRRPGAFKREP